jgi:quercetin 2,3-dioxygenase
MSIRPAKTVIQSKPTTEGAGVKLRRAFGFGDTAAFDPFLLLDDFRNDHPNDYRAGFPWHPHRGIETITYVLAGTVEHQDSLGNKGALTAGDVQWMTAGRGILHQEMPEGDSRGRMHGFQLWANLPSSLKMTEPRYQDVKAAEIPEIIDDDGTRVRVVCGDFWGKRGPVEGVAADPRYLDIWVPPGLRKSLPVETDGEYLFISLFRACAESLASENASRLAAMERADKNINELLEQLQGTFHRLRQSGIDEELFDVISGFEALVGSR